MKGRKMSARERRERLAHDVTERKRVFKELCDHVASGLSQESYAGLTPEAIVNCFSLYPEEFCKEELTLAKLRGRNYWEGVGKRQADGQCLGNSRTWYYNMANRYGWREKIEIEAEHKGQVSINVISYATQKASQSHESNEQT